MGHNVVSLFFSKYNEFIIPKDCSNTVFIFYIWRVNWRWYITGLILALAFFGMGMGQPATNPNQEIVVRFNTASVDTDALERAVAEVRSQLKSIGIEDVLVSETWDGKITVTYFSNKDIAVIENLFLQKNDFQIANSLNGESSSSKLPLDPDSTIYKIEVVKIQQDSDSPLGFAGTLIDVKRGNDQYLKPILSPAISEDCFSLKLNIGTAGCKTYSNISFLINNSAHKIPEVRAGPFA